MKVQGQLRLGGLGGVAGIDFAAAFAVADALGIDRRVVAELLPRAEAGLRRALNANDGGDGEGMSDGGE